MADATQAPAGTSYDDHHDGNATLSREEHLAAAGELLEELRTRLDEQGGES